MIEDNKNREHIIKLVMEKHNETRDIAIMRLREFQDEIIVSTTPVKVLFNDYLGIDYCWLNDIMYLRF